MQSKISTSSNTKPSTFREPLDSALTRRPIHVAIRVVPAITRKSHVVILLVGILVHARMSGLAVQYTNAL